MRCTYILVALIWSFNLGAACAQGSPTSGMGVTSPINTASPASQPFDSSGISLGATELNISGISPMPCTGTSSNSQFDGGGGGGTTPGLCGSNTSANSFNGSSTSVLNGPMMGAVNGSNIPLAATDLGTPGESQNVGVPGPSIAPCSPMAPIGQSTSNAANLLGPGSANGC
jgi:hypothetical protein